MRGGAERAYFDMAEILTEAGHEVAFFSMRHPDNVITPWSRYFVDGVEYGNDNQQNIFQKLWAVKNIWWNNEAQRKLTDLIRDFQPDVAHLHNIYHQLSPSIIWTLKKHNIPTIMTLHDYKLVCPNYSLFVDGKVWEKSKPNKYYACVGDRCVKNSVVKSLVCTIEAYIHQWIGTYRQVGAFIAPSEFLIRKFKEFGFEKDIQYVSQPILQTFAQNNIQPAAEAPFVFFGRLSQEKGVDIALRAMSHYEGSSLLQIIGSGPDELSLKAIAKELGVEKKVQFLGAQYDDVLVKSICHAKAVILPSIWYENMPYVLAESFGLGKVVIASRMGGITERIQDGVNGFLFTSGDVKELASKMMTIDTLSQDALQEIGNEAKHRIQDFTKNQYLKTLESMYTNLLSK